MPRKIIGAAFLSLDGVMQGPGAPDEDPTGGFPYGGWWAAQFDEEVGATVSGLFEEPFALLLGRRTYDIFAAYWPYVPPDGAIASAFNRIDKFVLTRSAAALAWEGSHRLDSIEAVAALKQEAGPDLVIQGSSTLYPQLLAHGLIDRLVLMTGAVILGTGKRLFGDGTPGKALRLIEHKVTSTGVVIAIYEPAGPVQTGSFSVIEPSERELARRRQMEQGTW